MMFNLLFSSWTENFGFVIQKIKEQEKDNKMRWDDFDRIWNLSFLFNGIIIGWLMIEVQVGVEVEVEAQIKVERENLTLNP